MRREVEKRRKIACLICDSCNRIFTESQVEEYWANHSEEEGLDEFDKAGTCESCGQSLYGGVGSLPWEDGDNAYAYIRCPHCGHENIQYGFGEDD